MNPNLPSPIRLRRTAFFFILTITVFVTTFAASDLTRRYLLGGQASTLAYDAILTDNDQTNTYVVRVVDTVPDAMYPGETVQIVLSARNTGNQTWRTDNTWIHIDEFQTWGVDPEALGLSANWPPGYANYYNHKIDITAPSQEGRYYFTAQMNGAEGAFGNVFRREILVNNSPYERLNHSAWGVYGRTLESCGGNVLTSSRRCGSRCADNSYLGECVSFVKALHRQAGVMASCANSWGGSAKKCWLNNYYKWETTPQDEAGNQQLYEWFENTYDENGVGPPPPKSGCAAFWTTGSAGHVMEFVDANIANGNDGTISTLGNNPVIRFDHTYVRVNPGDRLTPVDNGVSDAPQIMRFGNQIVGWACPVFNPNSNFSQYAADQGRLVNRNAALNGCGSGVPENGAPVVNQYSFLNSTDRCANEGSTKTFQFTFSDPNGAEDISTFEVTHSNDQNNPTSMKGKFHIGIKRESDGKYKLFLRDNANDMVGAIGGTGWLSGDSGTGYLMKKAGESLPSGNPTTISNQGVEIDLASSATQEVPQQSMVVVNLTVKFLSGYGNYPMGALFASLTDYSGTTADGSQNGWINIGNFTTPCTPTNFTGFRGEYFSDADLSQYVFSRDDTNKSGQWNLLDYNWGVNSPASGFPADNFSVRWTKTVHVDGANNNYRFIPETNDGVRLWVNGQQIVDDWLERPTHQNNILLDNLPTGDVEIKMEYFDAGSEAVARLSMTAEPKNTSSDRWKGEYYGTPYINSGQEIECIKQNEGDSQGFLDNFWAEGQEVSCSPVRRIDTGSSVGFSAVYTRTITVSTPATYNFNLQADDYGTVWINSQELMRGNFSDSLINPKKASMVLNNGTYDIKIELNDLGGEAKIKFDWTTQTTPTSFPDWKGEYFRTQDWSGSPALVRNDTCATTCPNLNINFGSGPTEIGSETFSARWTKSQSYSAAVTMTLELEADDYAEFLLDGATKLTDSYGGGSTRGNIAISAGTHNLQFKLKDTAGDAAIRGIFTTAVPTPVINISPTSLNFSAEQGQVSNESKAVNVTNTGGGTLGFTVSSANNWLNASGSYTGNNVSINVALNGNVASTMPSGQYQTTVVFTPTTNGTQKSLPVTFSIQQNWRGEYFNNANLSGTPVVNYDPSIMFDWRDGKPNQVSQSDYFSVRWTKTINFTNRSYRFLFASDDGLRIYIDNEKIVDRWYGREGISEVFDVKYADSNNLNIFKPGNHVVKIEYYEQTGNARVNTFVTTTPQNEDSLCPATINGWKGEYFSTPGGHFSDPYIKFLTKVCRDDVNIDFDWGNSSPATTIPADKFTTRWTKQVNFVEGTYQFRTTTDDGVRVYVDSTKIIDSWVDRGPTTDTINKIFAASSTDPALRPGNHTIKVEYYENGGGATSKFNYTLLNSSACPTTINGWKGEYFDNQLLAGSATICRDEPSVNFDWGDGSPAGVIPTDHFSARWTKAMTFNEGAYEIRSRSDDGIRVYIDSTRIIDSWVDRGPTTDTINKTFSSSSTDTALKTGSHTIKVEYYENGGGAVSQISITPVQNVSCPTITTGWKGEYYANKNLQTPTAVCREDPQINFNWSNGSPDTSIPTDNFSARWTKTIPTSAGTYTFTAKSDDGIRVYIDDVIKLDKWVDRGPTTDTFTQTFATTGTHTIKVEYYENGGGAEAYFSYTEPNGGVMPIKPTPSQLLEIVPLELKSGWVRSGDVSTNHWNSSVLYSGYYAGVTYQAGTQFDLSALPANVTIDKVELQIYGKTRSYMINPGGLWTASVVSSNLDNTWSQVNYTQLSTATSLANLSPVLNNTDLSQAKWNVLTLPTTNLNIIKDRQNSTKKISFRIGGPAPGSVSDVFAWDTGYYGGTNKPKLRIWYH